MRGRPNAAVPSLQEWPEVTPAHRAEGATPQPRDDAFGAKGVPARQAKRLGRAADKANRALLVRSRAARPLPRDGLQLPERETPGDAPLAAAVLVGNLAVEHRGPRRRTRSPRRGAAAGGAPLHGLPAPLVRVGGDDVAANDWAAAFFTSDRAAVGLLGGRSNARRPAQHHGLLTAVPPLPAFHVKPLRGPTVQLRHEVSAQAAEGPAAMVAAVPQVPLVHWPAVSFSVATSRLLHRAIVREFGDADGAPAADVEVEPPIFKRGQRIWARPFRSLSARCRDSGGRGCRGVHRRRRRRWPLHSTRQRWLPTRDRGGRGNSASASRRAAVGSGAGGRGANLELRGINRRDG